jgi:ribosome-associated protein
MPAGDNLLIAPGLEIPGDELEVTFTKSSGPGGQNVNKRSTKAILRYSIVGSPSLPEPVRRRFLERFPSRITVEGEIVISCDVHRDAARNADDCRERLKAMIQSVLAPPKLRRKTKPTRGSVERRLEAKRQRSQRKRDRSTGAD